VTNYQYKAVILDLDGVITQTARLHARAWKQMFDDYLPEQQPPFTTEVDYYNYVDGKPRYDGVSSFLASRDITLPQGTPEDAPGKETICGLGNRKNEIFLQLLEKEGVETYSDTVEQITRWRQEGVKMAVISSSRNCEPILTTAGLRELFDAKVDGVDSERLKLRGKPAPEIFWEAARQLRVRPQEAIVIEDAIAGIKAGVAGGFKLVVGVVRNGDREALLDCGADLVVDDLRELSNIALDCFQNKPSALDNLKEIEDRLKNRQLVLFTDYDGTLTSIVPRPEDAILSEEMRSLLAKLTQRVKVAVISGRDLADVQEKVQLENLYYAGSHGFEIAGGTQRIYHEQEKAQACLDDLDEAQSVLCDRLQVIPGVWVERKKFAIAVHYRQVSDSDVHDVESIVNQVSDQYSRLRKRRGKKIWELQPDIPWDKGRAISWLLEQLELDPVEVMPMYLGDDTTDEDAFQALSAQGISIRIGSADEPTQADYFLRDPDEVKQFFQELWKILEQRN
jgi:alpha,alpha-trehalase